MRFLKKCIKKLYHLIWFLSIMLIFTPNVFASGAGIVKTDGASYEVAAFADFADNTNGHLTRVNATFVENGHYFRSNDTLTTNGASVDGVNLLFDSNTSFVRGYTYLVSILVSTRDTYAKPSSNRVCIAETLTNVTTRYNNPSGFPCVSATVTATNGTAAFSDGNITLYYAVLNYIFTADMTGNSITMTYNTINPMESYHTFGGYSVTLLSDNKQLTQQQVQQAVQNSGLATAQSVTQVQQSITQVQQELGNIDDTINDDNVDGANSQVDDLLNNSNFNDSTGIQSIINAPLNFINGLTNSCTPINLTIPYIDTPVQLPCIKQELNNHIPLVVPVLSTAINGFIIYRILLDIVRIIKNARNPDDDRIEVLDL